MTQLEMKVNILNRQRAAAITPQIRTAMKSAVLEALNFLKSGNNFEINIMLVDDRKIHKLNFLHRKMDKPTDVLSFPMLQFDENRCIIKDEPDIYEEDIWAGDIVISMETAIKQAQEYGHSLQREVGFLTVHSMLHLFGYDHMSSSEAEEMERIQESILTQIGLSRS